MKLILVRNAECEGGPSMHATKAAGLTEREIRQATLLADRLAKEQPTIIYSSDFARALQTIEPLATRLRIDMRQESAFRPFNVGKFFGQPIEETIRTIGKDTWREITTRPDPAKRYFEGGETLDELSDRVWQGIQKVQRMHRDVDCVVVSTHQTPIASILCRVSGIPLHGLWFWGVSEADDFGKFSVLSIHPSDWRLLTYASGDHWVG